MSRKLPFKDAINKKLQQLSKPDEDQSWRAMEELLDKRKKRLLLIYARKYFVPVTLLLFAVAWWLVQYSGTVSRSITVNPGSDKHVESSTDTNHLTADDFMVNPNLNNQNDTVADILKTGLQHFSNNTDNDSTIQNNVGTSAFEKYRRVVKKVNTKPRVKVIRGPVVVDELLQDNNVANLNQGHGNVFKKILSPNRNGMKKNAGLYEEGMIYPATKVAEQSL